MAFLATLGSLAAQQAFAQFPVTTTVGARTLNNASGTVTSTGTISTSGNTVGVIISGTSTLTNNGTINQTGSGRAIDSTSNNSNLTITNTGLISAVSTDAFRVNSANTAVLLTNSGTIRVTAGGQAIDWAAITTGSNTLNNLAGGVISAVGEDAVRPGQNGIIINAGTISATLTGGSDPSGSDGIDLRVQKNVSVTNTGTISGRHGIATDGENAGPSSLIVNNNAGTISALNGSGINVDGVSTSVTANVTNAFGATIKGGVSAAAAEADGDGIDVDGVLTLNNSGDVLGLGAKGSGNNAEAIAAGGGTINNTATGRIIGSTLSVDAPNGDTSKGGNGILIDNSDGGNAVAATIITNSGLIQGKSGFGIKMVGTFADTITNNAGGVIRGTGVSAVIQTGEGNDTVTINGGSIVHDTAGTAVSLEGGNDTLNYNGGTISGAINGGTGTNTLNLGTGVAHSHGVQSFQNINVTSGSATLSGVVSGSTLTKAGAGTLQLTGANTYTGNTLVSAGTLRVNNTTGSATGSGDVTIASGASLAGAGSIAGDLFVLGSIAPGNSIDTLNVGGDVTWSGTAANAWQFELGFAGASDRLELDGSFLKGTGTTFLFDFLGLGEVSTYVLVNWNLGTNFNISDFSYINLVDGLTGQFAFNGSQLEFTAAAIPEPSTYATLIGLIALGVTYYRRRRARG